MILVRPRAWWFNKVPLTVTLVLLLADGRRVTAGVVAMLLLVSLTVCAMGNYGYAINELFDIAEDGRLGRVNAAAERGRRHVAWIAIGSALATEVFATLAGGAVAAIVTVGELCLPLSYSVPPLRLKERGWPGAAADGLAAHVYPALLALLACGQHGVERVGVLWSVCILAWAAAAGLRGILSHQLQSADADRQAGLLTVAHGLGRRRLEVLTVGLVLPVEAVAFGAALAQADTGPVLWAAVGLYLAYEAFKTVHPGFSVTTFRREGQRYVPFAEESFYKAWGPLALGLDAARHDLRYLLVVAAYIIGFRLHLVIEWRRLRQVGNALRPMGRAVRSSGGP